jgi:hypothetical protein
VNNMALRILARRVVIFFAIFLFPVSAWARVERFAVLIGNNKGNSDEIELRYAESEASRVKDVLAELGGFAAENLVVLQGANPADVRRALIGMNDRIRAAVSANAEAELFVYYSGHADALSLHLGSGILELQEFEQLVRGSSAKLRLLVVDACRSGTLTRAKGGKQVDPFPIRLAEKLDGQGMVFLSSAAADEDAQESDELRGSFFTHALVSGLRGAADMNHDGLVVLDEAYRYTYETTLRGTSRSLSGTQHPTYRFDFRGQGDFVLTDLVRDAASRGTLRFPADRSYIVFGDAPLGIVAEVTARDASRALALRPGRYFIRGRTPSYLLEGDVTLRAGESVDVRDEQLKHVDYARLARKGGADVSHAVQDLHAGYRVHTTFANASATALCHGGYVGYAFHGRVLSVTPRIGICRTSLENDAIRANVDELDAMLRFSHSFDLSIANLDIGLGLGGGVFRQSFDANTRDSPTRVTPFFEAAIAFGVSHNLSNRVYVVVDAEGVVAIYPSIPADDVPAKLRASFAVRPSAGLGVRF